MVGAHGAAPTSEKHSAPQPGLRPGAWRPRRSALTPPPAGRGGASVPRETGRAARPGPAPQSAGSHRAPKLAAK